MISIRAVQVNIFALTLSSLYASAPDLGTKYQKDPVLICYSSGCESRPGFVSAYI